MILNNLTEGLIIKNYRELCDLIGEKVKSGKSKVLQLNNLEKYVEYQKDGNKFIITKIYEEHEIIHKEIKRGRKSIYGDMIEVLLMDALAKKDSHLIISKSALIKDMGLVNDNYKKGYGNQLLLASKLDMTVDYVNEFYKLNDSNLNNVLKSALKSLNNKRLIDYKLETMIKIKGERQHRLINAAERELLLKIDKMCMKKFNLKSLDDVDKLSYNGIYHELSNYRNKLLEEESNIEFHYKVYDIVINHSFIEDDKKDLTKHILSEMSRLDEMEKLNSTFGNNIISNAEKRHLSNGNKISIRGSSDYVSHFKTLVKELIDLEAEELVFDNVLNNNIESLLPF